MLFIDFSDKKVKYANYHFFGELFFLIKSCRAKEKQQKKNVNA